MIEFGIAFEQFELDVATQSGKEMVRLSHDRLGR